MSQIHFNLVARVGEPIACPVCGMWIDAHIISANYRQVLCWCDNWLDITYVRYVIEELGVLW